MTFASWHARTAGLAGPAAVWGGVILVFLSTLMRGGNRWVALIALELAALWVVAALGLRVAARTSAPWRRCEPALLAVLASPLLLALLQLTPIPAAWWTHLPGHAIYAETMQAAGVAAGAWLAVSISPDASRASLLAGLPLVAAFGLGYFATILQVRLLLRVVVGVAFAQVLLGLLQISGGQHSPLFFGILSYGPPVGTFSNRNLFANFLALALAAYVWLAYDATRYSMRLQHGTPLRKGTFDDRHAIAAWVAGGLVLVIGILMSRSRGAALFGLSAAVVALTLAVLRVFGWARGWRFALPVVLVLFAVAGAVLGSDTPLSRVTSDELGSSAHFRSGLVRASLEAAWAFFPFGSGWGTYDVAMQRFLPAWFAYYPNHAHMDYVQMLVEGGLAFLVVAGCFGWLAARRALLLVRQAWQTRTLDREAMVAALLGTGLLGFLLHSLVDFNMRIPANAMLAALFAGAFLRPLHRPRPPGGA